MDVLILGVGDAFTKTHFGSSALVRGPEGLVMIDCPDPIHRVLHEASNADRWNVSVCDIHDIIITHLHGDHCNGLESFGFWRAFRRSDDTQPISPRLHTHPNAASRMWEKLAPAMDGRGRLDPPRTLDNFYELHCIEPGRPWTIAGLSVECRYTQHPIATVGLKISDGSATLGFSGDTPFEQAHIDWLADADVIIHETSRGAAHTPIEQLNSLPGELRSKMRLIHIPDDFEPSCSDIPVLHEGEVLRVSRP